MKAYVAKKVLSLPLIIFGVSIIVFIAIRALPGDPARLMAGPEAPQEAVDSMRVRLGLDQPLPLQYVRFAAEALHGNLGLSLQSQRPVMTEISERLPYTLSLAALAYPLKVRPWQFHVFSVMALVLLGSLVHGALLSLLRGNGITLDVGIQGVLQTLLVPLVYIGYRIVARR